jgi:hypothetical protein
MVIAVGHLCLYQYLFFLFCVVLIHTNLLRARFDYSFFDWFLQLAKYSLGLSKSFISRDFYELSLVF